MPKTRKMLGYENVPCLRPLMTLMETQSKVTLAHWSTDYAQNVIYPLWSKYEPDDRRPQQALDAARAWLSGTIKLTQAKKTILACHAAAREAEESPVAQAAARAIAQCASTIHAAKHSMGLVLYGALAVAYDKLGTTAPWERIEQCAADECERMYEALRSMAVSEEPNPVKIKWTG